MKKKTGYAVFTKTGGGLDYMVKGNFGNDREAAKNWAENNANREPHGPFEGFATNKRYPNGLFVKKIQY